MTITRLHVKDFQSLASVDLELQALTVIVGPSSCGKSALIRALKTLTANARGSSFVSTWATKTTITVDLADQVSDPICEPDVGIITDGYAPRGSLSLTRSAKTGNDAYTLTPAPTTTNLTPEPSVYTKLAGATPEEVTQFLQIGTTPDSLSLHFASQFDRPYLLADSPAEVARTFAHLTNVSVIFAAAREANRSRLAASSLLKTRTNDLIPITAQIPAIRHLQSQRTHLQAAEASLLQASALQDQIKNLSAHLLSLQWATETISLHAPTLTKTIPTLTHLQALHGAYQRLSAYSGTLAAADAAIERTAPLLTRPTPTLGPALVIHARLTQYRLILDALRTALQAHQRASAALTLQDSQIENLSLTYTETLAASGTCPTCGQSTHSLTHTGDHTA